MHDPEHADDKSAEAPLAEHIARNVQAVTEIQMQAERAISTHQRAVEQATALLGRPATLYGILAFVSAWMVLATLGPRLGLGAWDPPPFFALQGLVGLAGLLVTTMVLITQKRHAKADARHARLDLQLNMLTEQKVTKLIQLLEELRRDLPNVRNRHDAEVEVLKQPAEAQKVLEALDEQTLEAVRETVADDRAAEASESDEPEPRNEGPL